jgi:hypothetical protein
VTAALLSLPSLLRCVTTLLQKRKKKATAVLPSPSSFCFFCYKKKKKKATAALQRISTRGNVAVQHNVAFFATLRCSVAPQEQTLCCSAAPQEHSKEEQTKQTKQTNAKKSKDAYLGPMWVPLQLQP